MLHTYMAVWSFFFSAAPPTQNSPELHFRFTNFSIQLSLLESLNLEGHSRKKGLFVIILYKWGANTVVTPEPPGSAGPSLRPGER